MHREKFFLIAGIITLILLSACRSEPQVQATNVPPTEAPILSGRPEVPAAQSTRTPRPLPTNTPESTPETGEGGISMADDPGLLMGSEEQGLESLDGSWLWASITDPITGEKSIKNPSNYHLFIHESTISLITDCNFTFGSIHHDDPDISISVDESALSRCPLEEQQFVEKLNTAETFSIRNGRLHLTLAGSPITMALGKIDNTLPQDWDELLFALQNPFHENYCDAPAAILLVNGLEEPYLKAYGFSSLEKNIAIDVNTPMEIGGNTQSYTNVIILQLQEEGRLSLDDPLSVWLPDIAAQIPNGNQITLRHLAQNTSGIPDYADLLIQPAVDTINLEALQQSYTPQRLVNIALENLPAEPPFAPGEGWQYSTTNAILLGLIAEQITEQPLATLYEQRIFNPLGMVDTYFYEGIPEETLFFEGIPVEGTISEGYYTVNNNLVNFTDWNTSQGWAGGGIISTAEDMDRYIRGLFNGRLFGSVFTLSEMLNFVETGRGQFESYGLGIGQFADTSFQAWGSGGQTPGFMSAWVYVPASDVSVILLTNSGSCTSIIDLPAKLPPELFGLSIAIDEVPEDGETTEEVNACTLIDLTFPHPEPIYDAKRERDLSPFADLLAEYTPVRAEAVENRIAGNTILGMQNLLDQGTLTSEDLVSYYLYRIQTYDIGRLNSVMALNPEAIAIAQALDAERAESGPRGPMHGIPVLLKDNIATGDGMHTTAGAFALQDWQASEDAFLVQQLRDAGAIILGKANLSEWANWMDECMPNGFSTLGGQTRNPYGPFEVSGSSSGSAAAVAASLTTVGVGTETQGSIIAPASSNSVVGLKPSIGLVSRGNVIPLLPAQDVPGPMGRSVTDVAVLLSTMTVTDENDPVSADASELAGIDFTQFLTTTSTSRVGIVIIDEEAIQNTAVALEFSDEQTETYRNAVVPLNEAARQTGQIFAPFGVEIVEVSSTMLPRMASPNDLIEYGFRESLNQFLADLGNEAPIDSLDEIIALNEEDFANRAPYGQSHLLDSQNTEMTADEFAALVEENRETAVSALNAIFTDLEIDVLISSAGQAYAPAGYPAITVPNGYAPNGEPQGIVFVGDYLGEPDLITIAYIYEQATLARVEPNLAATIQQIESILPPDPPAEEPVESETTEEGASEN